MEIILVTSWIITIVLEESFRRIPQKVSSKTYANCPRVVSQSFQNSAKMLSRKTLSLWAKSNNLSAISTVLSLSEKFTSRCFRISKREKKSWQLRQGASRQLKHHQVNLTTTDPVWWWANNRCTQRAKQRILMTIIRNSKPQKII